MQANSADTYSRIDKLERSVRSLRRTLAVLVLAFGTTLLVAASQGIPNDLQVRKLTLLDDAGQVAASLDVMKERDGSSAAVLKMGVVQSNTGRITLSCGLKPQLIMFSARREASSPEGAARSASVRVWAGGKQDVSAGIDIRGSIAASEPGYHHAEPTGVRLVLPQSSTQTVLSASYLGETLWPAK